MNLYTYIIHIYIHIYLHIYIYICEILVEGLLGSTLGVLTMAHIEPGRLLESGECNMIVASCRALYECYDGG